MNNFGVDNQIRGASSETSFIMILMNKSETKARGRNMEPKLPLPLPLLTSTHAVHITSNISNES